ncbi:MAG: Glycine dehydrogenase (decarboxylating) [Magnetococcales bacterium]|nr:Glycine dehydrogenase (decarboxylating) [Magnetococcales bacterium]HIJ82787.1 aminomethyl-transferring glycine dehydrogenase subunit GcvPA [Magnetococcales bacterium]
MPFIPHTDEDVRAMLATIGIDGLDRLFEEIDPGLMTQSMDLPEPLEEWEVTRLMQGRAAQDRGTLCFVGAGAYAHHIPAAVWQVASRGEFYTAYTPYQAEASQGTLQVLYEFQTMMAALTGMDVSNASLYDGASALAEAVLMAVRIRGEKSHRILLPETLHPRYRETVRALVHNQGIELVSVPFVKSDGHVDPEALAVWEQDGYAALVVPQPNFFGVLEEVDALTDRVHGSGALVIGVVNPIALGLLQPPGKWGRQGADIACGEGQPLGAPLSSGGPGFGFLCCRTAHMRQIPGRIVGRTTDHTGHPGFVLTLQAREQHIRRARATSNICTNQGLMTVAASIHLSLLGPQGLRRTAMACHTHTAQLLDMVLRLPGVTRVFSRPFFHEVALRLPCPVGEVLEKMQRQGITGGYPLGQDDPTLENMLLVCATEILRQEDLERYAAALREALA